MNYKMADNEHSVEFEKLHQEYEQQSLFDCLVNEYFLYLQSPKDEPEFSATLQNELYDATLELSKQNMLSRENKDTLTLFTFYALDEDKRKILMDLIRT